MPKKRKSTIERMPHNVWRLVRERNDVFYADGRFKDDDRGRHSLGVRDRANALVVLRELDQHIADKKRIAQSANLAAQSLAVVQSTIPAGSTSPYVALSLDEGRDCYFSSLRKSFVTKGVTEKTRKRYRAAMTNFIDYARQAGLDDWRHITSAVVDEFAYYRETTPSGLRKRKAMPRTLAFEITFIQGVILKLAALKLIPPENHTEIRTVEFKESSRYSFSVDEVDAMLEHCFVTNAKRLRWLGLVILVLARTGMRISELEELRWSDIDLEAGVIRLKDERANSANGSKVRTLKSGRSRTIKLHAEIRTVIPTIERKKDGYVLHLSQGSKLDQDKVLKQFKKHVRDPLATRFPTPAGEVGFKDGVIHSFRHHFVARSFASGVPKEYVQSWLGHADSDMVNYYHSIHEQDSARQIEKLENDSINSKTPSSAAWRSAVLEQKPAATSDDVGDFERKESVQETDHEPDID